MITNENGYLQYTIESDEVTLDMIKVYEPRKGTGRKLIEELKMIASDLNLPIGLYAHPQDDSITKEDLQDFYYSCGFDLDADDVDGCLFAWGK